MNRRLRKYAFLPVLFVLAVGGGLLMRSNTGSKASETAEPAPNTAGTLKGSDTAKDNDPTGAGEAIPRPGDERRQLLETVGVLTAAHCYQGYLNIGLIADGKAKGTYTADEAYKFLDLILSLLDSVDQKLAVLGKMDLAKVDRASLEEMRNLSDLLHRQAKQLERFWDSGKDEDAAKYEDIRTDSWAAIKKITGIGR
jgi:hypothetical protein